MSRGTFCLGILVLSIFFKFWLIAEMEITDDPDDPPNYVAQILGGGPNFFGPGTGCAGKLFHRAGIPFRVGIEIAYLLACLLAVKALFDWPTKSYLSLGLFLFISFNPTPEELFSHVMSDQVWMVEMVLGLSLFVAFAGTGRRIRWLCLALAALCLGFSTITRTTIIPLMAGFLLWAVLCGTLCLRQEDRKTLHFRHVCGTAACIAFVGIFNYSTCFYHSIRYGYFGLSLPDSREYHDFYMCLQSVGDPTGDKYYPVDDHRLSLVAQAGPVSRQFVERMRTDQNFRRISRNAFGKFDFALAWFHFVVFFNTLPEGKLDRGFAMFRMVEDEITKASGENRLKVRRIIPLPDCRISIVLSAVPDGVQRLTALITKVPPRYAWAWGGDEPQFGDPSFTEALTRQAVAPSPLRENVGRALCVFYSTLYAMMLVGLELAVAACLACGIYRRPKISGFSFHFLARQLFAVFFVVLFFWYALFDASGVPASARLMIFQNVVLPLLLVYYFCQAWQLLRGRRAGFEESLCWDGRERSKQPRPPE